MATLICVQVTTKDQEKLGRLGAFDAAMAQVREEIAKGRDGEPFRVVIEAEN